jgi:hypothetical protein
MSVQRFAVLSVSFAAAVPAVWAQPYPAKPE